MKSKLLVIVVLLFVACGKNNNVGGNGVVANNNSFEAFNMTSLAGATPMTPQELGKRLILSRSTLNSLQSGDKSKYRSQLRVVIENVACDVIDELDGEILGFNGFYFYQKVSYRPITVTSRSECDVFREQTAAAYNSLSFDRTYDDYRYLIEDSHTVEIFSGNYQGREAIYLRLVYTDEEGTLRDERTLLDPNTRLDLMIIRMFGTLTWADRPASNFQLDRL